MDKHIKLLGLRVSDVVTGFEGVATAVSFELYGCVQVVISPPQDKDGKIPDGRWFDAKRLKVLCHVPVMEVPDFNKPEIGGDAKPTPPHHPSR